MSKTGKLILCTLFDICFQVCPGSLRFNIIIMDLDVRNLDSTVVCDHQMCIPASASAQSDQCLCYMLSEKQSNKVRYLISLDAPFFRKVSAMILMLKYSNSRVSQGQN